jgi:hypothetical protein
VGARPFSSWAQQAEAEADLMLARLMRFYPGLTVADHDAMPYRRLRNLIQLMENTQHSDGRQEA